MAYTWRMAHDPAEFNRKFLAVLAVLLVILSFGYVFTITLVPLSKDAIQLKRFLLESQGHN